MRVGLAPRRKPASSSKLVPFDPTVALAVAPPPPPLLAPPTLWRTDPQPVGDALYFFWFCCWSCGSSGLELKGSRLDARRVLSIVHNHRWLPCLFAVLYVKGGSKVDATLVRESREQN
jgi:hypothetical protein